MDDALIIDLADSADPAAAGYAHPQRILVWVHFAFHGSMRLTRRVLMYSLPGIEILSIERSALRENVRLKQIKPPEIL
jgi:hypothetical protein